MGSTTQYKTVATVLAATVCTFLAKPAYSHVDDLMNLSLSGLLNREVSVASKREEKLKDAPGIVAIIDSEEIRRYGARTLTDVLQRLPSVNIGGGSIYRNNVI